MTYDPLIHNRHSIRLAGYDYAQAGVYFVTLCTDQKRCLFGKIEGEIIHLNRYGRIVTECWEGLAKHYEGTTLDAFVLMPTHIHGIIVVGAGFQPAQQPEENPRAGYKPAPTVSEIIRGFKTFSARRVNQLRNLRGQPVWQRGFYDRVIRDAKECNRVQEYIEGNPAQWAFDRENRMARQIDKLPWL